MIGKGESGGKHTESNQPWNGPHRLRRDDMLDFETADTPAAEPTWPMDYPYPYPICLPLAYTTCTGYNSACF